MGITDILQPTHLLFILAIALLVLGPKRLPEVARSLGRSIRDFKDALNIEDHREEFLSMMSGDSATPLPEPQEGAEHSSVTARIEHPPTDEAAHLTTTIEHPPTDEAAHLTTTIEHTSTDEQTPRLEHVAPGPPPGPPGPSASDHQTD